MKFVIVAVFLSMLPGAFAEVKIGALAPKFSETDQNGKSQSLDSLKGKWVVLEWYNEDCPYVKKHYGSNNMQALQANYTGKGVVWLTVATSAEGKQGYIAPTRAPTQYANSGMKSSALLLDSDGSMGQAYEAKTTPHMFVINPEGKVVYAGAIDSNDSAKPETIKSAKNYVVAALDEGMAGKAITKATSKPYGCSVKYK